jgi:outer membrane protein OmpA-like peptidoglycan-associated protein
VIAVATLSLGAWGCATKKHVREAIAPVQQQVNQVQKDTAANKTAIGDLDRQVASADEKAQDAGRRAQEAASAAQQANSAAQQASSRADQANNLAQQAMTNINQVNQSLQNLDNYSLSNTLQVYFRVGQSTLSKEAKDQLDQAVANAGNMHNYIIEVEGFTDRTGGRAYNLELARRRADAVVRYLTVEKNIPLRDIRELGVGSDFPNAENRTRAQRKENRRVDVKIYALNLSGQPGTSSTTQAPNDMNRTTPNDMNRSTGNSDRMNRTTPNSNMPGSTMPQTTPQSNMPQSTMPATTPTNTPGNTPPQL